MDHIEIETRKKQLRALLRSRISAQAAALHKTGPGICRRALQLPGYRAADVVMAFVSTPSEPDTALLLQETLRRGKRLALPFLTGPGQMQAKLIEDLSCLETGPFGILQPPADAPAVSAAKIGFALVPCVAASVRGERLGHGGGYYDRFLPCLGNRWAVACPEALLLPSIPCLPHDLPAPIIITEARVLTFDL